MQLKNCWLIIICFLYNPLLYAQVIYSKTDLEAIKTNRIKEITAREITDLKALYTIGSFYEGIYLKYKDSSIKAAIRNYTTIVASGGSSTGKEYFQAAYNLGRIYSTGVGTMDLDKALVYYYISDETGKAAFHKIVNKYTGHDRVEYISPAHDSMVIIYHPLLGIKDPETIKAINYMAAVLDQHPDYVIRMHLYSPTVFYTSEFSSWQKTVVPKMMASAIQNIMGATYNIPANRIYGQKETNMSPIDHHRLVMVMKKLVRS